MSEYVVMPSDEVFSAFLVRLERVPTMRERTQPFSHLEIQHARYLDRKDREHRAAARGRNQPKPVGAISPERQLEIALAALHAAKGTAA